MSVTFKLIGYQSESKNDFAHIFENSQISLKAVYLLFMNKGMNIEDIKKIKFILHGESLNNLDKIYNIETDNRVIFIFTNDIKIKSELIKHIFTTIENVDLTQSTHGRFQIKPVETTVLEDQPEEEIDQTPEEITNINKKICEIFADNDFKTLLRICLNKPELLKLMNSYLSSGNIVEEFGYSQVEDFQYDTEYQELYQLLNNDNIQFSWNENMVKSTLNYFNGHVNLTLRYLLNNTQVDEAHIES